MMKVFKNNQNGATMMEALGVLTIIVMLGVSSIKLIGNIYGLFTQSLVINEIKDLQKVISDRYRFEGNYRELFDGKTPEQTSAFLCSEKMAPFQMCVGNLMYNKMGGRIWVLPVEYLDGEGSSYEDYTKYAMIFEGLSDRACVSAAQINWITKQKTDVFSMIINGGTEKELIVDLPYNQQEGTVSFPVLPTDVLEACNYNDNNQIEWIFF